jgi:DNA invertase Pin-like site-specific DNA recombinase
MPARPVNQHPNDADILLRVSTEAQAGDTHYSLPTQLAACEAFAAQRSWRVHRVEQDVITGATVHRPGFQAVLEHLRSGAIGRVIVYDVDRAGRDTYVGATLLHECKEAGATLHIQQMPDLELATGTPASYLGETMFFMRLTQAAQELHSLQERTQRGRRERVAAGMPNIGAVPLFGYVHVTDKRGVAIGYAPHPVYAPIVVRIFREVAEGRTVGSICTGLDADGIPTRSQVEREVTQRPDSRRPLAAHWQRGAISDIVTNPVYSGAPIANRHAATREHGVDAAGSPVKHWHKRLRSLDEPEVVPLSTDVWPPLVDAQLATRARARLAANAQEAARNRAAIAEEGEEALPLLRSGYVFCLQCGRPMSTQRFTRKHVNHDQPYWVYRCRKSDKAGTAQYPPDDIAARGYCNQSIRADTLDAEVWAHVVHLAEDERVAEAALTRYYQRTAKGRASLDAAHGTAVAILRAAEDETTRLVDAVSRERDERLLARLRTLYHAAQEHEDKARDALAALEEQQAHDPAEQQYADFTTWAREWRAGIRTATPSGRRQHLHRLSLRVFVWPAETTNPHVKRRFTVLLGWPQGIRRALPWLPVPLMEGEVAPAPVPGKRYASYDASQYQYMLSYLPELGDDHSEVAQVVASDRALSLAQGAELAATLGAALAEGNEASGEADASSTDIASATS